MGGPTAFFIAVGGWAVGNSWCGKPHGILRSRGWLGSRHFILRSPPLHVAAEGQRCWPRLLALIGVNQGENGGCTHLCWIGWLSRQWCQQVGVWYGEVEHVVPLAWDVLGP